MNLAVLDELEATYPDADLVLLESGGDNLTLTFSPELVDHWFYVIDVAGGDKIPRKRGQGLIKADLLVINKTDLAPFVGADLGVMRRDALLVREGRPFLFTDCRAGVGLDPVAAHLEQARISHLAGGRQRVADDRHAHAYAH